MRPALRRLVQGLPPVHVPGRRVGPALEQELAHGEVALARAVVQRREAHVVPGVDGGPVREQNFCDPKVPVPRCVVERRTQELWGEGGQERSCCGVLLLSPIGQHQTSRIYLNAITSPLASTSAPFVSKRDTIVSFPCRDATCSEVW